VGLEMVVQVVEWEWLFEMDVVGLRVVVVVEVNDMDNMDLDMDDIEEILRMFWMASISSLQPCCKDWFLG